MKKYRRFLWLPIVGAALLGLVMAVVGVSGEKKKVERLVGTWVSTQDDYQKTAQSLLEDADFYEGEIYLCDRSGLDYVKTVAFTEDRTYAFGVDPDGTRQCVEDFFRSCFQSIYEGRRSLDAVYADTGVTLSQLDEAGFRRFYADLYGSPDFDSLVRDLADNAYDYDDLSIGGESSGSFSIDGSNIVTKTVGNIQTVIGYEYNETDDTLTLVYRDGKEVYTRAR